MVKSPDVQPSSPVVRTLYTPHMFALYHGHIGTLCLACLAVVLTKRFQVLRIHLGKQSLQE